MKPTWLIINGPDLYTLKNERIFTLRIFGIERACRRLVTRCHALFQFDSWQRAISRSVLASNQSRGTWKSARGSGNSGGMRHDESGHGSLGRQRETHVHKGTYEESRRVTGGVAYLLMLLLNYFET